MKTIAIIPAKHHSKRIPGKNIKLLGGRPLLAYTIAAAEAYSPFDSIFLSTDSSDVADVVQNHSDGKTSVFMRDPDLAKDTTSTEDVLVEILDKLNFPDDTVVVTLLPTSPFRGKDLISRCVALYFEKSAKSTLSVFSSKLKTGTMNSDGKFRHTTKYSAEMHRVEPLILDNPSVYVTEAGALREEGRVVVDPCYGVLVNDIEGIDINNPLDWILAEAVLLNGLFKVD